MAGPYTTRASLGILYDEINRLFREILQEEPGRERSLETMVMPAVDVYETEAELTVEVELPGIDAGAVELSCQGGKLTLRGQKAENPREGRINYLCMERSFGRFQRTVLLTRPIDLRKARAVYRQGILAVSIPKVSEKRGERLVIPILVEGEGGTR
jgi:HSP20 family protein